MTLPDERERAVNRVPEILMRWSERELTAREAIDELWKNLRHYPSRFDTRRTREREEQEMR